MIDYTIDDLYSSSSLASFVPPVFGNTAGAQNAFTEGLDPNALGFQQTTDQVKNLTLDLPIIVVDTDESIQAAIDKLRQIGGGRIALRAGTYTIKTALTGYSSISIEGVSPTATILDFASTAANLAFAGSNIYTTGTVTAVSGVNVTGSGTLWLANVTAGQHIFIGTRWYQIAAVTGNTTLVLAEGYGDSVTFPATYRIATVISDVTVQNVGLRSSTGTALSFTDSRRVTILNTQLILSNSGLALTNCAEIKMDRVIPAANTSHGLQATNVGLCDWNSINSNGNGGYGWLMNTIQDLAVLPGTASGNGLGGLNLTSVSNTTFLMDISGNTGNGAEFVSGCSNCDFFSTSAIGNTSDGIKLTATTDNTHIFGCDIVGNGGYGINIAASSCDNTVITTNNFTGNSSGAVNDSGTGTLIRGNTGVNDNATSSPTSTSLQFVAAEALSQNDAVAIGGYQSDGGVTYDTSATGTSTASGGVATITTPITVGNNANRILILVISSIAGTPTATWNGTTITSLDRQQQSGGGRYLHTYYLVAPATGANNIVVSSLNATETIRYFVYSYYNAGQSGQPDAHNITQATTTATASTTPVLDGCLVFGGSYDQDAALVSASGNPNHQLTATGYQFGDNGSIMPQAAQSVSGTGSAGNRIISTAIAIAPVTTPVYGICKASSAASDNRSKAFIGFSSAAYSAGATATIITGGEVTTFSGLTPTLQYYLNDTNGSIGSTVGTVTRKVGIAVSSTTLVITNIW